MSQTEPPETREQSAKSKKSRNPRVSKGLKPNLCHIHDEVHEVLKIDIQQNVCVIDDDLIKHTDGKLYCLFHLPTKEKDLEKFYEKFRERLKMVEEKITEIENSDDDAKKMTKEEVSYDFCYVFFPAVLNFSGYKFRADANFLKATFQENSYFNETIFSRNASFYKATFSNASFLKATFSANVSFREATFSKDTYFSEAIFSGNSDFDKATFSGNSDFNDATFSADADFRRTKFTFTSQTLFVDTKFYSYIYFAESEIDGVVEFECDFFPDKAVDDNIHENEGERKTETYLDLKMARLVRKESVSFNSMKLRPCWFVNVEARNLVFNDVEWVNLEIDSDRSGLDREFRELFNYGVPRPKESLIKACNQLGDNAEANRRFEEARLFRKQSIALKNYECHIHDAIDFEQKKDIRKNVCQDFPVVNEDGGNYYCLWHNPDKNKAEIFLEQFKIRQENGYKDYRAVIFPITVEFRSSITSDKSQLIGKGENLPEDLNFSFATFYRRVIFNDVLIKKLYFSNSYFEKNAELIIQNSYCEGQINLNNVVFDGRLLFSGNFNYECFTQLDNALSLKQARFDKAEWIDFRYIHLLPHYFVDVDASKFIFHDCHWNENKDKKIDIHHEIKRSSPEELAQTCNQIAINYEEKRHYEEASMFRYAAMEAKRLGYKSKFRKIFNLYWLYKWTSGYGESRLWATGVLIFLIGIFSLIYALPLSVFDYGNNPPELAETFAGQTCDKMRITGNPSGMTVCDGIVHSLAVASFQRPDPKPADALTKFLVTLETILVPLQAALLALAIRRKFMR